MSCACCQLTSSCLAFALVLVAFIIILSLAYPRVRGLFCQDNKTMSINVKWGRERLVPSARPLTCLARTTHHLPGLIHSLQIPLLPPDTKLSVLRQTLAEHTRLPPNAFKLIYAGAVMKDDNAPRESSLPTKHVSPILFSPSTPDLVMFPHSATPYHLLPCRSTAVLVYCSNPIWCHGTLASFMIPNVLNLVPIVSAYNMRSGGTLQLLDSTPAASPPAAAAASKPPKAEASTIEIIRVELAAVRSILEPGVDAFLHAPTVDTEHTRLGELLLQALLRLDAITIDSTWLDARRERKGAVRAVQGVLDRLDNGWRKAKEQAQIQLRQAHSGSRNAMP